jgi:ABC-type antimicrobial peptide transport system permease subunit
MIKILIRNRHGRDHMVVKVVQHYIIARCHKIYHSQHYIIVMKTTHITCIRLYNFLQLNLTRIFGFGFMIRNRHGRDHMVVEVVSSNPAHGEMYLIILLCDKICQWLAIGRWISLGSPVSPTNITDRHNVTEILLKVALFWLNKSC